ncbi:mechanosensitive ion channel domain-containing protein, partial [Planctomycetota bacterium]
LQELVGEGAEFAVFNPIHKKDFSSLKGIVASNHDKLAIADGKVMESGGRNMAAHYYSDPLDQKGVYRDTDIHVESPVIGKSATAAFEAEFLNDDIVDRVGPDSFGNLRKRDIELIGAAEMMDYWLKAPSLSDAQKAAIRSGGGEAYVSEVLRHTLAQLPGNGIERQPSEGDMATLRRLAEELVSNPELRGRYDVEPKTFEGEVKLVDSVSAMGWVGLNLCDVVGHAIGKLTERTDTKLDDMLVPIVRRSLKLFVGLIAFILVVQNLGYPIGALLAGFSIGGIAFALASQDTLQNFFGSVMIFVDRPFQVGDWIQVAGLEGTVEEVGFRSTRVRTFAKTLITVPNSKVAHEAINNYSRMPKRRVVQHIGLGYNTEPARVDAVVNAFRMILKEDDRVDQQFWLVNFTEFGDSALNVMVYYFTKTTVWAEFLQTKQDIALKFMRALEILGVEIAFPTRTLYMREDKEPTMPPLEEAAKVLVPIGASPPAPVDDDADDDADGEG